MRSIIRIPIIILLGIIILGLVEFRAIVGKNPSPPTSSAKPTTSSTAKVTALSKFNDQIKQSANVTYTADIELVSKDSTYKNSYKVQTNGKDTIYKDEHSSSYIQRTDGWFTHYEKVNNTWYSENFDIKGKNIDYGFTLPQQLRQSEAIAVKSNDKEIWKVITDLNKTQIFEVIDFLRGITSDISFDLSNYYVDIIYTFNEEKLETITVDLTDVYGNILSSPVKSATLTISNIDFPANSPVVAPFSTEPNCKDFTKAYKQIHSIEQIKKAEEEEKALKEEEKKKEEEAKKKKKKKKKSAFVWDAAYYNFSIFGNTYNINSSTCSQLMDNEVDVNLFTDNGNYATVTTPGGYLTLNLTNTSQVEQPLTNCTITGISYKVNGSSNDVIGNVPLWETKDQVIARLGEPTNINGNTYTWSDGSNLSITFNGNNIDLLQIF